MDKEIMPLVLLGDNNIWVALRLSAAANAQRDADLAIYKARLKQEAGWLEKLLHRLEIKGVTDLSEYKEVKAHIAALKKESEVQP